jgi:hypothetical protein
MKNSELNLELSTEQTLAIACQRNPNSLPNISPKQNHKHPHTHRDPLAGWFCLASRTQGSTR